MRHSDFKFSRDLYILGVPEYDLMDFRKWLSLSLCKCDQNFGGALPQILLSTFLKILPDFYKTLGAIRS